MDFQRLNLLEKKYKRGVSYKFSAARGGKINEFLLTLLIQRNHRRVLVLGLKS